MAVKILISLDGADAVKAGLDSVNTSVQSLVKNVSGITAQAPLSQFTTNLQQVAPAAQGADVSTRGFSEAIHILNPVLAEAGIHITDLGGFARLARVGIEGLAVSIGASLVVAFANAEIAVQRLQANLQGLLGASAGAAALQAVKKVADDMSISFAQATTVVKSLEDALKTAQDASKTFKFVAPEGGALPPGLVSDPAKVQAAADNIIRILKSVGDSSAEATTAASKLFDAFAKGPAAAASALKALDPAEFQAIADALGKTTQQLEKTPPTIQQFAAALALLGEQQKQALDTKAVQTYAEAWQSLVNDLNKRIEGQGISGFSGLLNEFINELHRRIDTTVDEFQRINNIVIPVPDLSSIPKGFEIALNAAVALVDAGWNKIVAIFTQPITFSSIETSFDTAINGMVAAAKSVWDKIGAIFSQPINFQPPDLSAIGGAPFASGGLIRGPGSATSDSILARLSNNEFVISAAATQHYGAGFFAALNARMVPRDILPGFSVGGLVRAMSTLPAFAQGGRVTASGLRPIVLNIAGKGSFAGTIDAPEHIVAALSGEAVFEQLAAGGRSPGWRRT
jgi:tape measure domain-containing protein